MTDSARACYVYCVVPAGQELRVGDLSGVDPRSRVSILTHGELSALISAVRLDEFGTDALKRNLEDIAWLERTARAHNSVLARALSAEAVIPLRLCTIFADEARAREMLEHERERLRAALSDLRGRLEWSIKVLAPTEPAAQDRQRERATTAAGAQAAERPSRGRDYFARKKLERAAIDEAQRSVEAAAEDIHARLADRAAGVILLPPQRPELSGRTGRMVFNGAYLVDRSQAPAFTAIADASAEQYRDRGIRLERSGPWAPYNFVPPTGERA